MTIDEFFIALAETRDLLPWRVEHDGKIRACVGGSHGHVLDTYSPITAVAAHLSPGSEGRHGDPRFVAFSAADLELSSLDAAFLIHSEDNHIQGLRERMLMVLGLAEQERALDGEEGTT